MTPQFTAKGEKPEWLMIYDALLADAESGAIITLTALNECLGRDFVSNRAPLYRARSELAARRKRWLEAQPSIGYRVTEAGDHARLSIAYRRQSRRKLGLAKRVLESTDLTALTPESLAEWDDQQKVTFALWAVVHHESRLRKIESVLKKEGLM